MESRVNPFQETMLYWNDLMPYNAVHVARLPGHPDLHKLQNAVGETLRSRHLTHLTIDREKKRFYFGGAEHQTDICILPLQDDARQALTQQTEIELNTPFDCRQGFNPFRFFATQDTGAFYLGLVYFHAITDGEAIIRLLREIIDLYLDERRPGSKIDHNLCSTSLWRLLPKSPMHVVRWLHAIPGHIQDIRQSFRPPVRSDESPRTVFKLWDLDRDAYFELTRYARSLNVTLNDVFLGMLMKALSPFASGRFAAERRRKLAIAFIMNIRRDLSGLAENTFGMFLSSCFIAHTLPATMELDALISEIHLKTEEIKKKKLYVLSLLGQAVGIHLMRKSDQEHRAKFYTHNYPLWGGVTNIDLGWHWKDLPHDDFYYFRAASVGPAAPLTLAITTVNDRISLAVSANPRVYRTEDVEEIMGSFVGSLSFSPETMS